jgi:hypothetical protein
LGNVVYHSIIPYGDKLSDYVVYHRLFFWVRLRASGSFASDVQIAPTAAGSLSVSCSFSTMMSHPVRSLVTARE